MKQLIYGLSLTALLGITSIVSLPETVYAQTNRRCAVAISRAKNKILSVRNVRIPSVKNFDISDRYINFPSSRTRGYFFAINGGGSRTIINSTKLLSGITQNIINNCQSVSLVSFGEYATEENLSFGLMPNGEIKEFECDYPNSETGKVNWGYINCNV
jgi:hypothetical protein